jgi:hypothetical protein
MKKITIFLISAILTMNCVNIYAQTEMNKTEGCNFRFVLESPYGVGWFPETGIMVTIDSVDYGFINLPLGVPSAEETLLLPSGKILFSWVGSTLAGNINYFEIYNSSDELIYTSPDLHPAGLLFTYQNECNVSIDNYTSLLQIFPNPANNIVNILGKNIVSIQVFNNLGQLINNYHSVNSINVSSYKAGFYIFNVITAEGKTKAFKILITD